MEIYNKDCFEFMKENLKPNSVDLFLLDLPYGQTRCQWDTKIDLNRMWEEIKRTVKRKGLIIFFCTTKFGNELLNSKIDWFKYDLIWHKSRSVGFLNSKIMPLRGHEMIYVFGEKSQKKEKGSYTYNPQMTEGKAYEKKINSKRETGIYGNIKDFHNSNEGTRYPVSVQKFKNGSNKSFHKTQKPLNCLEWLIKSYSNEGDLVCDFTMGSGSCGEACRNTKRRFIGCEKNKEIFEVAKKRLENED